MFFNPTTGNKTQMKLVLTGVLESHMLAVPAFGKLRQEAGQLKVSLGYTMRSYHK